MAVVGPIFHNSSNSSKSETHFKIPYYIIYTTDDDDDDDDDDDGIRNSNDTLEENI